MRNFVLGLSLSVAFVVGCMFGASQRERVLPPARAASPTGTQWQYYCLDGTKNIMSTFRKLGLDGWELVGGAGGAASGSADILGADWRFALWCFKRRI